MCLIVWATAMVPATLLRPFVNSVASGGISVTRLLPIVARHRSNTSVKTNNAESTERVTPSQNRYVYGVWFTYHLIRCYSEFQNRDIIHQNVRDTTLLIIAIVWALTSTQNTRSVSKSQTIKLYYIPMHHRNDSKAHGHDPLGKRFELLQ